MFPGCALAVAFGEKVEVGIDFRLLGSIFLAFVALCFASSANYVINEWLDRSFDRLHPLKKYREAAQADLSPTAISFQYLLLISITVVISLSLNTWINLFLATLLIMGVLYNVRPIRLKDRFCVDVVSESVNNPIRLAIGWYSVASAEPVPASAFLSFWGLGIFLMALKRYSEMRVVGDKALLSLYRPSFARWTPDTLLTASFVGALISLSFGGVLLGRRNVDYVLMFPSLYLIFSEYFRIALTLDPATIAPEQLMRKKKLQVLALVNGILFLVFTLTDSRILTELVPLFSA